MKFSSKSFTSIFALIFMLSAFLYACNNSGEGENGDNDTMIVTEEDMPVAPPADGMDGTNNAGADGNMPGTDPKNINDANMSDAGTTAPPNPNTPAGKKAADSVDKNLKRQGSIQESY